MTLDEEIFVKTKAFVAGRLDLDSLYTWVMDREPYWGEPPSKQNAARQLAAAIELSYWEMDNGDRDEASAREVIAEELAQLTASRPS